MKRRFPIIWLTLLSFGLPTPFCVADDGQSQQPPEISKSDPPLGSDAPKKDGAPTKPPVDSKGASGNAASTAGDPLEGRSLDYWIEQLSSKSYSRRERATTVLLEAGDVAVRALVEASREGDFEVVSRTMQILQQTAYKQDIDDEGGAFASLQEIAASGLGARGVAARQVLRSLVTLRDRQAREKLLEAGVQIGQSIFLPHQPQLEYLLRIDDRWSGDLEALRWIRWVRGLDTLVLSGEGCRDDVLRLVCRLKSLERIQLNDGKLSKRGIEALIGLDKILHLGINYVSMSADVDEALVKIPLVQSLVIREGKLSEASENKIRSAFPFVAVDINCGGFLGVLAGSAPGQCQIGDVLEGGAAVKAGLRARDVILEVNGHPIEDFFELKDQIGKLAPGEPMKLQVQRFDDGELKTLELRAVLQRVELP